MMAVSDSGPTDGSLVAIQRLFDYNRFRSNLDLLVFAIWSPIGFCCLVIRTFIGLHALLVASLMPKRSSIRCFILRAMCTVLGVIVKEEDASIDMKTKTKVIVSNHITNIDHMAVDLVLPCIVPGVWDLPKFLNWGLGFRDFGVTMGRDVLIQNVKMHLNTTTSPIPILCYPEGATTNGRAGLLKFGSWVFTLDFPVQPILITVWRPLSVSPSVLGSRWWSDLIWFLIVPFTVFTIKYLPVVKRSENESPEEFAKRVQRVMAQAMKVVPTAFSDADKIELAKRLFQKPQITTRAPQPRPDNTQPTPTARPRSQPSATASPVPSPGVRTRVSAQIEEMARKVKEVLPQVPLVVILKDIKVTTNIDETITRLLDGTVPYVPETVPQKPAQNDTNSTPKPFPNGSYISTESSKPFYCGSKTFGKNATERAKSYRERKEALIEAARRRYLERHEMLGQESADNN